MPSRISVMLTASSVAPRAVTTSRSRSWVMGRAGRTPCCSKAIAAASTAPIQMGRYRSPCVSLSSRIGWLPGSSTRTPMTRSSCTVRLLGCGPGAAIGVGDEQTELHAVGQLLGLEAGSAGELLRCQRRDPTIGIAVDGRWRRHRARAAGDRRQGLAAVERLEVLLDDPQRQVLV